MTTMQPDYLIIGAGVFGLSTALALRHRGYNVYLISSGAIPHPDAASNDISKVVRMEYGSDKLYMQMAARSLPIWRRWNLKCDTPLYRETGFLLLSRNGMDAPGNRFERASYDNLLREGYRPQLLKADDIRERYPAFAPGYYADGFYHGQGGFAEAARTVEIMYQWAIREGVTVLDHLEVVRLLRNGASLSGIETDDNRTLQARQYIICTGAYTLRLLPELKSLMRTTAHPVFHIRPENPDAFTADKLPVFAADISNSGWYGFPLHPTEGVVKVANHGRGIVLDPASGSRAVPAPMFAELTAFLQAAMPGLARSPVVHSHLCPYADTADGHFIIDRHPHLENVIVATGGSGHAFKMAPVLGDLIASAAEDKRDEVPERFHWREPVKGMTSQEEARGG